jgi:hypothetical protein
MNAHPRPLPQAGGEKRRTNEKGLAVCLARPFVTRRPGGCPIDFHRSAPAGANAPICPSRRAQPKPFPVDPIRTGAQR